jgi:rhodanese-related sulfurtransferase
MTTPVEITPAQLQSLIKTNQPFCLIDCREDDEFAIAIIDGAKLVPLSRWEEALGQLQLDASQPVVVHCHHGMRSLRATQWLRRNGYPDAQSLSGGIDAWSLEVDPSVPRY